VVETPSSGQAPPAGHRATNGAVPEGHPPLGDGPGPAGGAAVDPNSLPLKESGSGSRAELTRARAATQDPESARLFAEGFLLTFTSDTSKRDYPRARELFQQAIALDPKYAEAYRGLAYAEFNIGFNREAAFQNYEKALQLKPDYGEAHYAMAFLYAMDDVGKGAEHFQRAMELGIEDERNLGQRFYPQVKIETH
jgi:tetratricopeptide (TPR) repeat protein